MNHQEFNAERDVLMNRDDDGVVRQLDHLQSPVETTAQDPGGAAAEYLAQYGDLFGITGDQLRNLEKQPSDSLEDSPIEYRQSDETRQFDTATIGYYQTDLGLPVWQAGITVQVQLEPARILSAQSTLHTDLRDITRPSPEAVDRALSIDRELLSRQLGLDTDEAKAAGWDAGSLEVQRQQLVVFRYEPAQRTFPGSTVDVGRRSEEEETGSIPTLPLPPVPDEIQAGQHYVCNKIDFSLTGRRSGLLNWVAIVEVESLSVLYLRAFVDHVNGLVFERDPSTTAGGPAPNANNAALNPRRSSVLLPGLVPPVAGTQELDGNLVQLTNAEPPNIAAPSEPVGTNFDYDARTNNFAAVNAYYHCDRFFRMLDGMGMPHATYLKGTSFPSVVDHRGSISTSNGVEINAHCVGTAGGTGILRTTFALADLSDTANPLGLACDYRVVLHELAGHGVLYNYVSSPNFGFAHSAGDGIAAILNDPGSLAPDRFLTFPWVSNIIDRRHDRTPAGGWGYAGNIGLNPFDPAFDYAGYNNEQILASAHFRLYRSIGGDAASLATRSFAARMTVYLILRAIGTLTPATNPNNATGWVSALQTADAGDWVSENITGGAYGKVMRWAFEQQGLFQAAGTATPNNNIGAPPPVDAYIDDGRAGEYPYQPVHWFCKSIWNRRNNDGGTTYEEPVTNQVNYAYVKLKNRGSQPATNVVVKAYHANPAAGLLYPIDWFPMNTPQLAAPDIPANNAAEITVGPFEWVPTHVGHECIFMVVSANGDPSNTTKIKAGNAIPEWRLVPNDNNIGQRNVFPISGGGTTGLVEMFNQLQLELKNPHPYVAEMEVRFVLPEFLQRREWRGVLSDIGEKFRLEPGDSRTVGLELIPGGEFSEGDVYEARDRTIHVVGYANGVAVGGMSYELRPDLRPGEPADDPPEEWSGAQAE